MEDDRRGTGVAGDVVADLIEILLGVAVGPDEEFERAFSGGWFLRLEFVDVAAGEAAAAGAVVELDRDFQADDIPGDEDSGISGGDETLAPEHDFAGAGEVLDGEDAEGLARLGHARFDAAYHPGDGVALAGVVQLDLIDQADAVVFVGI